MSYFSSKELKEPQRDAAWDTQIINSQQNFTKYNDTPYSKIYSQTQVLFS
jgi:hypothetical protein